MGWRRYWSHAIRLHAHRWWASATRTLPSYSPTRASLHARELEMLPPSWHGRGPIAFGVWWGGGRLSTLCGWAVGSHVFGRPTAHDFAGRAWSPLMSRTLWPIRRRSTRLSSRLAERLAAAVIRTRYRCRLTTTVRLCLVSREMLAREARCRRPRRVVSR